MCKLVVGLFCAFSFIVNSNVFAANPLPESKPFRIAFYMDDFHAESLSEVGSKIAVTQNFSISLHQKASDVIIVSVNIFKNFVGRRRTTDFFKSINFKLEDWNIYSIKDSNFFALVLNNKESLVRDSNIVKIYDTVKWKPKR